MRLENKLEAREIVQAAGMSARPEFYSGRGVTSSDLNYCILEKIYQRIEQNYGKQTSKEYLKMVRDIPFLSATDFLLTFYNLEANGWKWSKKLLPKTKGIYVDGKTEEQRDVSAMFTIASVLGRSQDSSEEERNTQNMKFPFLKSHGIRPKQRNAQGGMFNDWIIEDYY